MGQAAWAVDGASLTVACRQIQSHEVFILDKVAVRQVGSTPSWDLPVDHFTDRSIISTKGLSRTSYLSLLFDPT
jgi:hypothetical protein